MVAVYYLKSLAEVGEIKMNKSVLSWFKGLCKECGFNVVVTQPNPHSKMDYFWYCSNRWCDNHKGEHTGDMETPAWVEL